MVGLGIALNCIPTVLVIDHCQAFFPTLNDYLDRFLLVCSLVFDRFLTAANDCEEGTKENQLAAGTKFNHIY